MEPVPASSKTDLPLAKAKPVSNGGSTPGILKKGRKSGVKWQWRERSETM